MTTKKWSVPSVTLLRKEDMKKSIAANACSKNTLGTTFSLCLFFSKK